MSDLLKSAKISDTNLNKVVDASIASISLSSEEFGASLKKWKYLIVSSARKIAAIGQSDAIDAFQDLLVPLSKIYTMHAIPLYRYKGCLFELVKEDGFYYKLTSPRYNQISLKTIWIRKECVEKVKKASLDALIYTKIQQQASVILRSCFSQKNGYVVTDVLEALVKLRNGGFDKKSGIIQKNVVARMVEHVSFDDLVSDMPGETRSIAESICSNSPESDALSSYSSLVTGVASGLSDLASDVLEAKAENPEIVDSEIRLRLGVKQRQVIFALREIQTEFLKAMGSYPSTVEAGGKTPFHFTASMVM